MRVGPVQNSRTLNLGTFQFKPLQGGHLSKADKNFCPVSVHFREVPLYEENIGDKKLSVEHILRVKQINK